MGSAYCYSLLVNISAIEIYSNGPSKVAAQSNKNNKNYNLEDASGPSYLMLLVERAKGVLHYGSRDEKREI